ncbi:MAG: hypothetical protein HC902_14330 [Calothrix sp. SM1_5_4]|nr:hypothetical protein [Calothrix sp. SM1_5_4]
MSPSAVWAWGKRGHQIVAETAAHLVAGQPEARFLRNHSFDLGYYANVPDVIWKKPATYDIEKRNTSWTSRFSSVRSSRSPKCKSRSN